MVQRFGNLILLKGTILVLLRLQILMVRTKVLKQIWKSWFLKRCQDFNYFPEAEKIDNAYKMITRDGTIDFGLLHEPFQKKVISRILDNKADKARLISLTPYLSQPGKIPGENLI